MKTLEHWKRGWKVLTPHEMRVEGREVVEKGIGGVVMDSDAVSGPCSGVKGGLHVLSWPKMRFEDLGAVQKGLEGVDTPLDAFSRHGSSGKGGQGC